MKTTINSMVLQPKGTNPQHLVLNQISCTFCTTISLTRVFDPLKNWMQNDYPAQLFNYLYSLNIIQGIVLCL